MVFNSEYGKIEIDRKIFAKAIKRSFTPIEDRAYLVNLKCKPLGGANKKININELAQNIFLDFNDNQILIKTYIVISFGKSIKETTNIYFDNLENEIHKLFPNYKLKLVVKILGVKSLKLAPRNVEVFKEYEVRG